MRRATAKRTGLAFETDSVRRYSKLHVVCDMCGRAVRCYRLTTSYDRETNKVRQYIVCGVCYVANRKEPAHV